ncbi:hypothetical protein IFM89_037479 [Coptis chinensis]|uniref:Uncharacterized protein n=1 Tax=Coptis chinensis TaxID=261450 RepID=A0A835LY40_9MAGN|nr:hypothetical protein IFM89_037479 [Coptis chinensis]
MDSSANLKKAVLFQQFCSLLLTKKFTFSVLLYTVYIYKHLEKKRSF